MTSGSGTGVPDARHTIRCPAVKPKAQTVCKRDARSVCDTEGREAVSSMASVDPKRSAATSLWVWESWPCPDCGAPIDEESSEPSTVILTRRYIGPVESVMGLSFEVWLFCPTCAVAEAMLYKQLSGSWPDFAPTPGQALMILEPGLAD